MIKINELYHYGMPRRSGRYPWGSGERPYQGDIVKSIDDAVKKNKNILKEKNKELAADKIEYQMRSSKVDNRKEFVKVFDRLSEKSKKIDKEVEDIINTMPREVRQASKNPELKKDVFDNIYKNLGEINPMSKGFRSELEKSVYAVAKTSKYMPDTVKKINQLNKNIDDYNSELVNEVNNLVGSNIGQTKIPKTKSGVTYGEVLKGVLSSGHDKFYWIADVDLEMQDWFAEIEEDFLGYALDKYR